MYQSSFPVTLQRGIAAALQKEAETCKIHVKTEILKIINL